MDGVVVEIEPATYFADRDPEGFEDRGRLRDVVCPSCLKRVTMIHFVHNHMAREYYFSQCASCKTIWTFPFDEAIEAFTRRRFWQLLEPTRRRRGRKGPHRPVRSA